MSLLSENIIPGNYGKVFKTNAKEISDLEKIKNNILSLKGIKDVILNYETLPREFTIHTSELVRIDDVEKKVKLVGYNAIPKGLFPL